MNIHLAGEAEIDENVLVLGCGNKPYEGAVNHDITKHSEHVDIAFDLNWQCWPVKQESFKIIIAEDVLEHLDDFIHFFDECWRILRPGGQIVVQVPRYDSENVWRDPTHRRGYHADCFRYLDPDSFWGRKYGMYTDKKWKVNTIQDGDNILAILSVRKE